jgi:hypothetical protein
LKNSFITIFLLLEKAHEEGVCEMVQSSSLKISDNRGHFSFTTIKDWNDENTRLQSENRTLIQPSSGQKKSRRIELYGYIKREHLEKFGIILKNTLLPHVSTIQEKQRQSINEKI